MSDPLKKPAFTLDPVLIIALLSCALLVGGLLVWRASSSRAITDADFDFAPIKVDAKKLGAERTRKYADVQLDQVEEAWAKLVGAAREANEAQFGAPKSDEEIQLLKNGLRYWASEVIPATGYDGFVAAGQPLRDACEQGLGIALKALEKKEISLKELKEDPPPKKFSQYRQNCGNIAGFLVDRGLITARGEWAFPAAPVIADLSARYVWADIIGEQRSPWAQLTPYEAELFARWRIEHARGYTHAQRERYLEQFARLSPQTDLNFTRGVLAYQTGNLQQSLESFQALAATHPERDYDGYLNFLRERLDQNSSPVDKETSDPIE